jgi:hypothetical protein
MRRILSIGSLLIFTALAAMAGGKAQTFTGTVSDSMCGAKHTMDGSPAECTRSCVKEGSSYALVVGDKVYRLTGKTDGLDALAGEQATVTGTANGDSIEVTSVKAAK